jgi:5-formyltetrahydrofolate cyclo-ligase
MTSTGIDGLAAEKAALRARLKAARDALPDTDRHRYSVSICQRLMTLQAMRSAGRVFVFISSGTEIHTHDLIRQLLAEGREVAVPKIVAKTEMIACRLHAWEGLRPAQLGILSPIATEPLDAEFDVVVTPGLGFTEAGQRIGFGAGYYDRWFAGHLSRYKIAVAFEAQIVPSVPTDENDIPVDAIVTEQRLIAIRNGLR